MGLAGVYGFWICQHQRNPAQLFWKKASGNDQGNPNDSNGWRVLFRSFIVWVYLRYSFRLFGNPVNHDGFPFGGQHYSFLFASTRNIAIVNTDNKTETLKVVIQNAYLTMPVMAPTETLPVPTLKMYNGSVIPGYSHLKTKERTMAKKGFFS